MAELVQSGRSSEATTTTLGTQRVLDSALATRPTRVIHHTDQGSQCTAIEFSRRCRDAGVRPLTGTVGDAYHNATCESDGAQN